MGLCSRSNIKDKANNIKHQEKMQNIVSTLRDKNAKKYAKFVATNARDMVPAMVLFIIDLYHIKLQSMQQFDELKAKFLAIYAKLVVICLHKRLHKFLLI